MSLPDGQIGKTPGIVLGTLIAIAITLLGWNLATTFNTALKIERLDERLNSFELLIGRYLDQRAGR